AATADDAPAKPAGPLEGVAQIAPAAPARELPRAARVFHLNHVPAAEIKDKVRPALSEQGTVELDDRMNQIVVTDWPENMHRVAELTRQLDGPAPSPTASEVQAFARRYGLVSPDSPGSDLSP